MAFQEAVASMESPFVRSQSGSEQCSVVKVLACSSSMSQDRPEQRLEERRACLVI